MVQVGFVFISILFPEFRDWALINSETDQWDDIYDIINLYRRYGFAGGFTFSMPLYQGLCVIIASALGAFKSSKYYLLVPFFLFSIVINARIALISTIIVMVVISVL